MFTATQVLAGRLRGLRDILGLCTRLQRIYAAPERLTCGRGRVARPGQALACECQTAARDWTKAHLAATTTGRGEAQYPGG
jgi:hypothetical protein